MISFKLIVRLIICLVVFVGMVSSLQSQIIVNEVLANEPGSSRNLEWLELYVTSPRSIDLADCQLLVDGSDQGMLPSRILDSGTYVIICRRLLSTDGNASFEQYWGDASTVWGDCSLEIEIGQPIETGLSLVNDTGLVELFYGQELVSTLAWGNSGEDGRSWERVLPDEDIVIQSLAHNGSTPGSINSSTPVPCDLAIAKVLPSIEDGQTKIEITFENRGWLDTPLSEYVLFWADSAGEITGSTPVMADTIHALLPSETFIISIPMVLTEYWNWFVLTIPDDDRSDNNYRLITVPGGDYPPVIITEFLANPKGELESEWIELANISGHPIDLQGWMTGDQLQSVSISSDEKWLAPDERIILAFDMAAFGRYYQNMIVDLIEPSSWPRLNDAGDAVKLSDPYGLIADSVEYNSTFDDNFTWSRSEKTDELYLWGRSEISGGTPGESNQVVLDSKAGLLKLIVEPTTISPDGDDRNDSCLITVEAPDNASFELRIFDRYGREVCNLQHGTYRLNQYVWRGKTDSGRKLPVGIYILFCEAAGAGSAKKALVIAR